jgi:hypothetical protein
MSYRVVTLAVLLAAAAADAGAIDFSTPEKAFAFFGNATARRNVDDLVASRDFVFEARERLAARVPPSEEEVLRHAKELEAAYRERIAGSKPRGLDYSACKIVKNWRLRESLVKLVLHCPGPGGGDIFTSLRMAKNAAGWHVVFSPSR